MAHRLSTRRYARALFELGVRQNQLDKWQADLDKVADLSRNVVIGRAQEVGLTVGRTDGVGDISRQ